MKPSTDRTKCHMSDATHAIWAIALAGAVSLIAAAASCADLEVSVKGLRSAEGKVVVAVHQRVADKSFPDGEGVIAGQSSLANPEGVTVVFADLPPGEYAVAAFHDTDGDLELDRNILQIPIEGYGFSNGAVGFRGPPSFDDAAVAVGSDEDRISVVVPIAYPGF